ncbi:hypothetical protein K2173_017743 [Erythroxylum novogranatense]|uniref:BSD domain-containing protein n=1 Tax=Erythroxylum novogranatense TaxID=1862640 RepID=A0AAV8SMD6_9ROSI|nr:hypothetical protein K2173_017743 [Erythroxylum novogranatense]
MSWIFRSLQSNDPDSFTSSPERQMSDGEPEEEEERTPENRGGVKEDFSVIGETIGRQLRGVANFLAPPPSSSVVEDKYPPMVSPASSSRALLGIRNDLAELTGSLKSGLSLLSVGEISKFTSNILSFDQTDKDGEEKDNDKTGGGNGDEEYVPGITEDVINFVKEISRRTEYWTDFPLSLENDFRMSDAQREHASTVEQLVPSFRDLRARLSSYVEDEKFWMVYFILLLPRLNEHDFEIFSTPQIVETRNLLLHKLQTKRNEEDKMAESSSIPNTSEEISEISDVHEENISSNKKEATEIVNANEGLEIGDGNSDHWLEESDIDTGTSSDKQRTLEHEEDVSFSDLEDDDNDLSARVSNSRRVPRFPSPGGSSDWVQLNENSETHDGVHKVRQPSSRDKDSDVESSDWLKVDDFD